MVNCVFLAQRVIFTACLMVTPLNLSSASNDWVISDHCLLNSLCAVQLCLAMVSLVHKVMP